MSRKRIIIDGEVVVTPHFSGIGHYTLEILHAIDRQINAFPDLEVELIVYFRNISKARNFRFKHIRLRYSFIPLRVANRLKAYNLQFPLDLIYGKGVYLFPNFSSWPLIFSKSASIIHDLSFEKYAQVVEPKNQQFLSSQVRQSVRRSDIIITISNNSKEELAEFYDIQPDSIIIAYPAVDMTAFKAQTEAQIKYVKKKYGIEGSYILFVGNLEPRKNLKNLLLAYETLPKAILSEYALVLVGAKGWRDTEITAYIKQLQAKGYPVRVPARYVIDSDLPSVYSGASLFVYPSIYEGFGIPPLEAMACKVPVICANNSALPEAVGDNAVKIDAHSIRDIASAIHACLTNPSLLKQLSNNGPAHAQSFSWDKSAKNILEALSKL